MKISIDLELTDQDARILRSWASVGRHFDQTLRLVDKIAEGVVVDDLMEQDSIAVEEDVRQLKDPLSSVHYQLREKLVELGVKPLWKQD